MLNLIICAIMDDAKFVITVGRQFGSGGREVGRYIADKLGVAYYDKELLAEASKDSGVCAEFFERADERSPSFFDNLFSFNPGYTISPIMGTQSAISPDNLYAMQCKVIMQVAIERSCVCVAPRRRLLPLHARRTSYALISITITPRRCGAVPHPTICRSIPLTCRSRRLAT